jgi:serine/threonine protein kinase
VNHASTSTTRTLATRERRHPEHALVARGEVIASPESRLKFVIERMLGEGGFGQVFLAQRMGSSSKVDAVLCVKVSPRIDGWLREAYFGQLLAGHPRAIRIFDAFPLTRPDGRLLYCLALEYARHGDLRAYLHRVRQARGRSAPCAARSPASSRCSGSSTAASCCTAT